MKTEDTRDTFPVRPDVRAMPGSLIRELANAGVGRDDIIPLWFGESDRPTPGFIVDAAVEALRAGQTFYTQNRGIPSLREEVARYLSGLRKVEIQADRVTVTSSGVSAIMVVMQCLVEPGDNVVMVTPIWPNCADAVEVMGGEVRRVGLNPEREGWRLDVERLSSLCDGRTRAIFLNSPNNPTGWVATRHELETLLEVARRKKIWLITDEVYERIVYEGDVSPSFLDFAEPDDLLISVNSFSKAWCMTGWRLGWLVAPAALGDTLGKLIEINTSCAGAFMQEGGIAALRGGEAVVAEGRALYADNRKRVEEALSPVPGLELLPASGTFYAFFRAAGVDDSLAFAKRMAKEIGVGLAPGSAFGAEGEGWLRLCYAQGTPRLQKALPLLADYFQAGTNLGAGHG